MSWGTCKKCSGEMDMHYELWCPICDKPEKDYRGSLDMIKCLTYLEAHGHKGIHDRMWKYLIDFEYLKGNDTHSFVTFGEDESDDMKALQSTFDIGGEQLFEYTW